MLKKVFAIVIAQFYIFSTFGLNLHQCFCCVDDSEIAASCSMTEDSALSAEQNPYQKTCNLCSHAPNRADAENTDEPCGCKNGSQSEDCEGTSISVTAEIHKENKPQLPDSPNTWSNLDIFFPVLISYFFFKDPLGFQYTEIRQQFESSVFKLYQQNPLFERFCVYRN